jgi:hypothetical protein
MFLQSSHSTKPKLKNTYTRKRSLTRQSTAPGARPEPAGEDNSTPISADVDRSFAQDEQNMADAQEDNSVVGDEQAESYITSASQAGGGALDESTVSGEAIDAQLQLESASASKLPADSEAADEVADDVAEEVDGDVAKEVDGDYEVEYFLADDYKQVSFCSSFCSALSRPSFCS